MALCASPCSLLLPSHHRGTHSSLLGVARHAIAALPRLGTTDQTIQPNVVTRRGLRVQRPIFVSTLSFSFGINLH